MRKSLPFIFVLAVLLLPLSVQGGDVRHPEKTLPSFSFVLPDNWSHEPDTSGNLIMFSPNRTTGIVIIVAESAEALDTIAAASLLVVTTATKDDETAARLVHNGLKLVSE